MQPPQFTACQFATQELGWQQAIRQCCQPLIEARQISIDYVDAIISETLTGGPYYIISPGFALPHARPEQGVITAETCFSLLRLAQPVAFANGERVSLIIVLAAGNGRQHTDAITHLLTWLDDGKLERLMQACDRAELEECVNVSVASGTDPLS